MTSPGISSALRGYRRACPQPQYPSSIPPAERTSLGAGFSLPETFGALVCDEDLPWLLRLRVFAERDGIAKCTSLTVEVPDLATIESGGEWEPVTPAGF